jgi:hypothetical protein
MKVRRLSVTIILVLWMAGLLIGGQPETACAISSSIVISQVYGGGGNPGATYTHDFIELFNRGTTTVSLAGWSVQYASATGTGNFGSVSSMITELPAVSLAPGQYLLIQEGAGVGGTMLLPTPDVTDATPIYIGATGGKVALVNTTTPLGCNGSSTPCSPAALATIVDLVGWGGANFFEGSPAPATSNTTAIIRNGGGSIDTDNNASDFTVGVPTPRNKARTAGTPCTYNLSAASGSYASVGGPGSVSVTALTACAWTAASNAAWIAVTSGSSGKGNGTVNYSVSTNTSPSARTATMTIAGQTFTVTQGGGSSTCTYLLSPTSRSHGPGAETGSFSVTAPSGCAWIADSPHTWITITSNLKNSGNGTVNYSVSANTTTNARTATMTIAGQTFTVTQSSGTCTYSISPTSRNHGLGAETGSVSVTAPSGCVWTAASHTAWIAITSGSSGNGNGTVNYSVSANTSVVRTDTMTIAGQIFQVTQSGIPCTYLLSPTSRNHGPGPETGSFNVTAPSGCHWSIGSAPIPSWITITPKGMATGSGNGTVNYSVSANTSPSARTATMTMAGQTFTVTQSGVSVRM